MAATSRAPEDLQAQEGLGLGSQSQKQALKKALEGSGLGASPPPPGLGHLPGPQRRQLICSAMTLTLARLSASQLDSPRLVSRV